MVYLWRYDAGLVLLHFGCAGGLSTVAHGVEGKRPWTDIQEAAESSPAKVGHEGRVVLPVLYVNLVRRAGDCLLVLAGKGASADHASLLAGLERSSDIAESDFYPWRIIVSTLTELLEAQAEAQKAFEKQLKEDISDSKDIPAGFSVALKFVALESFRDGFKAGVAYMEHFMEQLEAPP